MRGYKRHAFHWKTIHPDSQINSVLLFFERVHSLLPIRFLAAKTNAISVLIRLGCL